jgi:hypothetical protein
MKTIQMTIDDRLLKLVDKKKRPVLILTPDSAIPV